MSCDSLSPLEVLPCSDLCLKIELFVYVRERERERERKKDIRLYLLELEWREFLSPEILVASSFDGGLGVCEELVNTLPLVAASCDFPAACADLYQRLMEEKLLRPPK